MNKEENLSLKGLNETNLPSQELEGLEARNHVTVGRRSFLRGLGIVGATLLPASAILMRQANAQERSSRHERAGHVRFHGPRNRGAPCRREAS